MDLPCAPIWTLPTTPLPNPADASQDIGTVRVARFGWKADISNLMTFSADANKNEVASRPSTASAATARRGRAQRDPLVHGGT